MVARKSYRTFVSLLMKTHFIRSLAIAGLLTAFIFAGCSKQPEILVATMKTNHGTMVIQLFEDIAPITVANFTGLAEGTKAWTTPDGTEKNEPFYDGLTFHRVIKDFMIQGGCPQGTGRGGPGYEFEDETYVGSYVVLEGEITDEDMAHEVFNSLIVPYYKSSSGPDRSEVIAELIQTMGNQSSYNAMVGMTVEQLKELTGSNEALRFFRRELKTISGEITDSAMADAVFQELFAPHLREHEGESPVEEISSLYEEILAADGPDPLIGKTVEYIQGLVGNEGPVEHPILRAEIEYGNLCMANSGPNTNGSQFFIVTQKKGLQSLNGKHTVFGKVIEGMEVALAIQDLETDDNDKPVEPVEILSIRIDRISEATH